MGVMSWFRHKQVLYRRKKLQDTLGKGEAILGTWGKQIKEIERIVGEIKECTKSQQKPDKIRQQCDEKRKDIEKIVDEMGLCLAETDPTGSILKEGAQCAKIKSLHIDYDLR
jgi:hypothetical protein